MGHGRPSRTVLGPGKPGSYNSCGQWLNHAEPVGSTILGLIHDETACRYELGQTHKSMSLATSSDYGLTWKSLGQILTGSDAPAAGKNTGEGDCTAVDGHDGYYYAYCRRNRDHMPYVARAPVANPGPSHWQKYFNGGWSQPGLGGDASRIAGSGGSASYWLTTGETVSVIWAVGGMGLALSHDRVNFTNLGEPDTGQREMGPKRPAQ